MRNQLLTNIFLLKVRAVTRKLRQVWNKLSVQAAPSSFVTQNNNLNLCSLYMVMVINKQNWTQDLMAQITLGSSR